MAACSGSTQDISTARVARQTVSQTVTATGTLNAQDTILVGSQVSGTIQSILVDYNSRVTRGEILARLDPAPFQAALDQASAALAQIRSQHQAAIASASGAVANNAAAAQTARAQNEQIASSDAAVRRARSALDLALLTQQRDLSLFRQGYVAQDVIDNDATNASSARAALVAAQTQAAGSRYTTNAGNYQAQSTAAQASAAAASLAASDAAVRAAEATVEQARLNLDHATITSPVDGTVIARNVSIGQTVAAAFASPTLFTIAKNLGKMELDVAVGEPDVGSIRAGQPVLFTVLAYPGQTFSARVEQVRQNPTVVQNVTTYTTVAYVDNPDGRLRPGMTANTNIVIASYRNALVVPLGALQWRPSAAVRKAYTISTPALRASTTTARSIWGAVEASGAISVTPGGLGRVFVAANKTLRGVGVRVLAVNGSTVAVTPVSGPLRENDAVVVGEGNAIVTPSP